MSAVRAEETRALTYSSRAAADWWALFRKRGLAERFTTVQAGFLGDVVDVACDDQDDAEWLLEHMVSQGIPKAALRVIA